MVTMQDVARAAGVSAQTVSNVVNGRPGATDATRKRVMRAVAELGYELNLAARELRVGRSDTIALLVPHIEGAYFAELATHFGRAAHTRGLRVAVQVLGSNAESELAAIQATQLQAYVGAVMHLLYLDASAIENVAFQAPVVFLGEREMPGFDHVMMDNAGGTELATTRLIELGARRIALIGGEVVDSAPSMATLRTNGYRTALTNAGIPFDPALIVAGRSYGMDDGYNSLRSLIDRHIDFDAVLALTDEAAIGVVRALVDHGKRVPQDVQVIGFDNLPETEYLVPRLSSVDPGTATIVETVIETLVARIAGVGDPSPRTATPARAVLIERESTRSRAKRSASSGRQPSANQREGTNTQ